MRRITGVVCDLGPIRRRTFDSFTSTAPPD
jgi:hypothetical protein